MVKIGIERLGRKIKFVNNYSKEFKATKVGLKQRDALSSILFNINLSKRNLLGKSKM